MEETDKRETMIMWGSTKSRALKKIGDFKRQGIDISSQDDLINFLLDNLKTPQEEIKDLLIPLRHHLKSIGEIETYLRIASMLKPITDDPILNDAIDFYKDALKLKGEVSEKDFKRICKHLKIDNNMIPYYKKKVLEELNGK